ncbi:DNA-directed RNA polymerase specialized sigma subunit, sigma24 [Synechococcus sp. PCC 7502]|uniref:DNA-directed RNA polymerase subunit sigma-24 n=1 Tax=Synechococcus sp. PCC 7502 TaxID=1173263 RepID=UPI00029FAB6D|nr:DNA-directed RNA polymerase subunit sigma-24 [Synechococcus sp. PCC 7502]AFY72839.1 DNA-directed RNA polymerase specialized sigma subunit, sigma24 [Synechococcus sp. PCC 7502]
MVFKPIETNHPLVKPLIGKTDQELLTSFRAEPQSGKYLVLIFCRYGQIIYTLTHDVERSPIEADYLFVQVWKRIFQELRLIDLEISNSLQSFLTDIAAVVINEFDRNNIKNIKTATKNNNVMDYNPALTSPPFLWYLDQALAALPKDLRLVLVLSQTFDWSSSRIAAYLRSEGEGYQVKDIEALIARASLAITELLPQDIQEIYLLSGMVKA